LNYKTHFPPKTKSKKVKLKLYLTTHLFLVLFPQTQFIYLYKFNKLYPHL